MPRWMIFCLVFHFELNAFKMKFNLPSDRLTYVCYMAKIPISRNNWRPFEDSVLIEQVKSLRVEQGLLNLR